jgi:hypothetical protein
LAVGPGINCLCIRGIHFETQQIEEEGAFEIEVSVSFDEWMIVCFFLSMYFNWIIYVPYLRSPFHAPPSRMLFVGMHARRILGRGWKRSGENVHHW